MPQPIRPRPIRRLRHRRRKRQLALEAMLTTPEHECSG